MGNEDNNLDFEVDMNPDFESMGYEMSGAIEFYEHPETGEGAYRVMLFSTTMEQNLKPDEDHTVGQILTLVTQEMLTEYIERDVH